MSMAIQDGSAVMFVNGISSMHKALEDGGYTDQPDPHVMVAFFSIFGTVGRLTWGIISDFFPSNRAAVLLITMVGMLCSHALLAILPEQLFFASITIGFFFGGMFALAPIIIGDLFGHVHFGTNWGLVSLAPASGSLIFGFLYGKNYDNHVDFENECRRCKQGVECFRDIFTVTSVFLILACVSNSWLALRIGKGSSTSHEISFDRRKPEKQQVYFLKQTYV